MCEHCDQETESLRTVVDTVLLTERNMRKMMSGKTVGHHVIRLANAIVDSHVNEHTGCLDGQSLHDIAIEYSIVVQRLLALEEMSGLSAG